MSAMKIYILIVLMVFSISSAVHRSDSHKLHTIKKLLKGKLSNNVRSQILHIVTDSDELDKEEKKQEQSDESEESEKREETKPEQTLLSLDRETLKSSAKYPKDSDKNAVYGNLDSLGTRQEESKESKYSEESEVSQIYVDSIEGDDNEGSEYSSPGEESLQSSAKYPKISFDNIVYKNPDKEGITQEESKESKYSEKSEVSQIYVDSIEGDDNEGSEYSSPGEESLQSSAKYPKISLDNIVYKNPDKEGITEESKDSEESEVSEIYVDSIEGDDNEGSEYSSPGEERLQSSAKYPKISLKNIAYKNPDKEGITKIVKKIVKIEDSEEKEDSKKNEDSEVKDDREEIKPGKTLLSPDEETLQSSAKYPKNSDKNAVYGNLDNLGITYDSVRQRLLNTGFRRHFTDTSEHDPLMTKLLDALQIINEIKKRGSQALVFVKVHDADESDVEDLDSFEDSKTRRKYDSDTSDETNPDNPYTVHKNKYLQNWLWNFEMDGDHMNINPRAPSFGDKGPSGAALFYGRKWWYYNQDDYLPLN